MIVPFVFSMSTFRDAPYLWWFYKGLDFAKRSHSAVIAQEIYCKTSPAEFAKQGRTEAYDKQKVDTVWQYRLPKNGDLRTEKVYTIPDSVLEPIVREKGSITGAAYYLLGHEDPGFCEFLRKLVERIESECEPIEAFMTLVENPSLTKVAETKGIPVIHIEMGCLRHPNYLNTAFWDLESLNGGLSVEKRWKRFDEECRDGKIPIFSKQECLAILLQAGKLSVLENYHRLPKKKIGVLLGYTTYELISYTTQLNDSELLFRLKKKYGLENMLIRKHPGDPYGGQYPLYADAMDKPGRSSAEFFLDCSTIVSLLSGGAIEAMLLDRKAVTILPSPAYYPSGHEIEGPGKCPDEAFLSFFVFCYLIPLEFLADAEYVRWRLTMPSESDIFRKHVEFYFRKKGLPLELMEGTPGSCLQKLLKAQGV